jgi:hypothetical protein
MKKNGDLSRVEVFLPNMPTFSERKNEEKKQTKSIRM